MPLTNSEQDIGELAVAIAGLPTFAQLERGQHFAVQTRLVQSNEQSIKRAYSSGMLNKLLPKPSRKRQERIELIKKPQIVISLLCTAENSLYWHFACQREPQRLAGRRTPICPDAGEISRAEFKLLEALEVFGVSLPSRGRALDLGAAPGGWTRLLLEASLSVVAVDPANLDPRLNRYIPGWNMCAATPKITLSGAENASTF